jgi:hypothetical protein
MIMCRVLVISGTESPDAVSIGTSHLIERTDYGIGDWLTDIFQLPRPVVVSGPRRWVAYVASVSKHPCSSIDDPLPLNPCAAILLRAIGFDPAQLALLRGTVVLTRSPPSGMTTGDLKFIERAWCARVPVPGAQPLPAYEVPLPIMQRRKTRIVDE